SYAETRSNIVTLTATDLYGNSSNLSPYTTLFRCVSPTVLTQDITVYLDATGNVSITANDIDNGSTDNCAIDILSLDITDFTCAETGANIVILTTTELYGNSSNATATVTVVDSVSP